MISMTKLIMINFQKVYKLKDFMFNIIEYSIKKACDHEKI